MPGTITALNSASLETTVNYYRDRDDGREDSFVPGSASFHKREYIAKTMHIENIRGHEADFTLPKHGFQLIKHTLDNEKFSDESRIKAMYPEVVELMKNMTGASTVVVFSHLARRVTKESVLNQIEDENLDDLAPFSVAPPSHYAHIDNSPECAELLAEKVLGPQQRARLSTSRWAIINFWKPLSPVLRDPLAVSDYNTVDDDDFVNVYAIPQSDYASPTYNKPDQTGVGVRFAVLNVRHNPRHKWYYASRMQPDEALLIKIFDTAEGRNGKVQGTPHTAITHKEVESPPARESVEFRTMVLWEDEGTLNKVA